MATSGRSGDEDVDNGNDTDHDRFYNMTSDPRGNCLIINNKNFQSSDPEDLPTRHGTDRDRDALRTAFEGLGFNVKCHDDVTARDMVCLIRDVAKFDHSNYDCFVCCILSHGCLGSVFGSDGEPAEIRYLTADLRPMGCPTLSGKPKIFFLQVCQGKGKQIGYPNVERDAAPMEEELVPNEGDFLLSCATVPGFESYRDPNNGTVYIQKLAEQLMKPSTEGRDIINILTKVNLEVGREHNKMSDGHAYKQSPSLLSSLRKTVVLGPGIFTASREQQESRAVSGVPSTVVADRGNLECGTGTRKEAESAERLSREKRLSVSAKTYTVDVFTGNLPGAGTDANVFLNIFGDRDKSKERKLDQSETNKDKFERARMDRFYVEAADLGKLRKVRIRHDNSFFRSDWYLDRVEITDPADNQKYVFHCECWLANKQDCKIERTLYVKGFKGLTSQRSSVFDLHTMRDPLLHTLEETAKGQLVRYEVTVCTGDVLNAATDAGIIITVFGSKGSTAPLKLTKNKNSFERGSTDTITVEMYDVAPLKTLRVTVEPKSGARKSWYLEKIELRNMSTDTLSVFSYDGWLGEGKEGTKTSVDIAAIEHGKKVIDKTDYKISVETSKINGAGTDANVYVVLFGLNGDSGELHLKVSETNKDPFEKGRTDIFTVKDILSLGELSKLRIWHDNRGFGAAWHLASIDVKDLSTHGVWTFPCDRWLSESKDDKQIVRELICAKEGVAVAVVKYEVSIHTGDVDGAGTDANVCITIYGVNGNTGKRPLKQRGRDLFERGRVDKFRLEAVDLGELAMIRVEHDNKGFRPGWFLDRVEVFNTSTGATTVFLCQKWFDRTKGDFEIARDIFSRPH